MYSIPARKKPEDCDHEDKKDFSFQTFYRKEGEFVYEKNPHFFCPDCRSHWFKDKEWTPKEWDDYINA